MSIEKLIKSKYDSQLTIYNSFSLNDLEVLNQRPTTIHIIRIFSYNQIKKLENFKEIDNIYYSFSQDFNYKEIKTIRYNEEEKKEIKEYILLKILQQRKNNAKKISNFLKNKLELIKVKKENLIQKISVTL